MRLKVSNVCQLINKTKIDATKTVYGITFTNDGSGVIIANGGPSTGQGAFYVDRDMKIDPTHIYLNPKSADIPGTCALGCDLYGDGSYIPGSENGYKRDVPFKFDSRGDIAVFYYAIFANKTVSNLRLIPQLFDLTEMYGVGHEPTTVEQFRQDFPNEMYDYSPVCWKKFRRLKYVAETKNLLDYGKFNPIWKTNGIIRDSGYLSKPASTFNTSLFYPTSGYSVALSDVSNLLQLKGTYTFSISSISVGDIYIMKYNADGTMNKQVGFLTNNKKVETLTFDELTYVDIKIQKETAVIVTGLMVQEDSTAIPYQPYGYLPLNRGKYIANKEPVQLLDKSKYPATITNVGVTFTNNGDGTVTLNGTNAGGGTNLYSFMRVSVKAGHCYYIYSGQAGTWGTCMFAVDKSISANIIDGYIGFQGNSFDNCDAYLFIGEGATFNNYVVKPQFFDLTEMYGAGNEPKTVAQFRADFPNELYDYNPYNAITFR